jgi:hypothetical protein
MKWCILFEAVKLSNQECWWRLNEVRPDPIAVAEFEDVIVVGFCTAVNGNQNIKANGSFSGTK